MQDLKIQLNNKNFSKINFLQLDHPIFSANKITKVFGIWESDFLDGEESIISWKKINFSSTKPDHSDIYVFVSNTDNKQNEQEWHGPYRNNETILTHFSRRYMKIRAVMTFSGEYQPDYQYLSCGPTINSIDIQCVTSENTSKFFTRSFDIGFNPKYMLLTSETEVPPGGSIRYGVTNVDSTKNKFYQFFEPNKNIKLESLPITGNKIKVFIEMSGSAEDPVVVHEFAVMFSDRDQKTFEINR
jgi:hypothetical protein